MAKPKLIIVEGPQGSGKSILTNYLREYVPHSTLLRLNGLPKDSNDTDVFFYHTSWLHLINVNRSLNSQFILDRSFVSEKVYCDLGYKNYDFKIHFDLLAEQLNCLREFYDIKIVLLKTNDKVLEKRLKRNKFTYSEFSVESSKKQYTSYAENIANSIMFDKTTILEGLGEELTLEDAYLTIVDDMHIITYEKDKLFQAQRLLNLHGVSNEGSAELTIKEELIPVNSKIYVKNGVMVYYRPTEEFYD